MILMFLLAKMLSIEPFIKETSNTVSLSNNMDKTNLNNHAQILVLRNQYVVYITVDYTLPEAK